MHDLDPGVTRYSLVSPKGTVQLAEGVWVEGVWAEGGEGEPQWPRLSRRPGRVLSSTRYPKKSAGAKLVHGLFEALFGMSKSPKWLLGENSHEAALAVNRFCRTNQITSRGA